MIEIIPCYIVTDDIKHTCMAVFQEDYTWTNSAGMTWEFKKGDSSDGHSTGKYFRHFDDVVISALCHDQDCTAANDLARYSMRKAGDKAYKFNLKDLGASWATIHRRYAAVSAYSRWLKMKGDLK